MDVQLADVGRVVMPGILPDKAQAVATLCQGQGAGHEEATLYFAAARIAALLGIRDQQGEPGAARYGLPLHALLTDDAAAAGILDESHLWGGVVPFPFVATKLVSHPLWQRDSVPRWAGARCAASRNAPCRATRCSATRMPKRPAWHCCGPATCGSSARSRAAAMARWWCAAGANWCNGCNRPPAPWSATAWWSSATWCARSPTAWAAAACRGTRSPTTASSAT